MLSEEDFIKSVWNKYENYNYNSNFSQKNCIEIINIS